MKKKVYIYIQVDYRLRLVNIVTRENFALYQRQFCIKQKQKIKKHIAISLHVLRYMFNQI